jgi:hypothetical protein
VAVAAELAVLVATLGQAAGAPARQARAEPQPPRKISLLMGDRVAVRPSIQSPRAG